MTKNYWTNYAKRLGRVTAYIYDHLDEEIDLQKLADVACLSPYHWHRIYHAVYGETLAATVKRLRLHRAAGFLAHTSMAIEKVAEKSGYKNLQSFTRTFGAVYGMPPAQYRKNGSHTQFQPQHRERNLAMYDVAIKTVSPMKAIIVEHIGSYMEIGKAFDTLYGWLGARNLINAEMRSIGIYYDDPTAVPEERLRSCAAIVAQEEFAIETPLRHAEIPAGTYAVLRHKGAYADMRAAYQWLYGEWLVQSGREAADAPVFEEYLNNPRDTAPTELLTDIYLPLVIDGNDN
ncbi:MAG TPA: AraC family transcriptional regulator [Burkholderiales bacterium]|nr:AraC family transcriptional regulator [Burkholderiales bacterium]